MARSGSFDMLAKLAEEGTGMLVVEQNVSRRSSWLIEFAFSFKVVSPSMVLPPNSPVVRR
jgi:hypothetical protein